MSELTQANHESTFGLKGDLWERLTASGMQSQVLLACVIAVLVSAFALHVDLFVTRAHGRFTEDVHFMQSIVSLNTLLFGSLIVGWLVQPTIELVLHPWLHSLAEKKASLIAGIMLTTLCLLSSAYLIHYGRNQFGAFDYNILLNTGWLQTQGLRPYVDFITTAPPFFNLGLLFAFRVFGVSWNAMLYTTALFTCGTLIWQYHLLRRLGLSRLASTSVSVAIESAAMLSCCFWWYNNTTLVLAALFFLSSLALLYGPARRSTQISFAISLALLLLAKPNIAAITVVGSVILLKLGGATMKTLIALLASGVALSFLVLGVTHTSVAGMLASYRGVMAERGALSAFGFNENSIGQKELIELWYGLLLLPIFFPLSPLVKAVQGRRWAETAKWLFPILSGLIAIYGLRGNGELRDVEIVALLCSIGLLGFSWRTDVPLLKRLSTALLLATVVSNLFTGAARLRVYSVGLGKFFEWSSEQYRVPSGPLEGMLVSPSFEAVNLAVEKAVKANPGPYFFGPRVDYAYSALNLPYPKHFPAWWHPGTAFNRQQVGQVLSNWDNQNFRTLVFLKGDYTYYPPSFLDRLSAGYRRDDSDPLITVYRRIHE